MHTIDDGPPLEIPARTLTRADADRLAAERDRCANNFSGLRCNGRQVAVLTTDDGFGRPDAPLHFMAVCENGLDRASGSYRIMHAHWPLGLAADGEGGSLIRGER